MRTVVLVGVLAVVCPATARAGSISLDTKFQGQGLAIVLNDSAFSLSSVGSVSASAASELGALDDLDTFEVYCVDFFTDVFSPDPGLPTPPATYNATAAPMVAAVDGWSAPNALNTPEAAQRASWLYNEYADTFLAIPPEEDGPSAEREVAETQRAALQMAIWNVLYDNDFSVAIGAGDTYITGDADGVTVLAQTFLTALGNSTTVGSANATWLQLRYTNPDLSVNPLQLSIDAQDFIGPNPETTPVPEPSAGLLLSMGAMSLAAFRSRKSLFRRS
jgi:hypothetical protein